MICKLLSLLLPRHCVPTHSIEPRGHYEEGCRSLVTTRSLSGGATTTLQDVIRLRLAFMGLIVLKHKSDYVDCIVQERRNSSALAMELHLSCTNPSMCNVFL